MDKYILGIETSCDDTSVAVVAEDGRVLSSVTASQIDVHQIFGGVFPEFAAREHIRAILPTVDEALKRADIKPSMLEAIGVTRGPGLIGSLLVGIHTAAGLGICWNKPVIGVNHLRGHLRSADLEEKRVEFPAIVLLVSGGHTILSLMQNQSDVEILGYTKDDSVGEAYDKVARMLGLGYPGGPPVDKMAKTANLKVPFPRPVLDKGYEFSFSGLKSAVGRYMDNATDIIKADVAGGFVDAVMEVLLKKSERALRQYPVKSFVIVGGVAASPQLREQALEMTEKLGVSLCLPPLRWATDNGAMIALAAWDYIRLGIEKPLIPDVALSMSQF